ncbi:U32 family peptidase [Aquabacterium fontiphilum]|uniref:ubiquinone anaerobic biosynthesis protein UbiU n=1 Tax=Aquabacterium fontiphilum TaxID=450365 RepID=UPI001378E304|nr:peptidase U32 family protein [Aquabacterium fontiphilum]NBD21379.1 U32 family peptidase [Aquabacterium fontiphilum]
MTCLPKPELVCPAGSPRAFDKALKAGADAIYLGLRDPTNARNFAGLNFTPHEVRDAVTRAHRHGRKVLMALNTFAHAVDPTPWFKAVDAAAAAGVDALIAADAAVLAYACRVHPQMRRHLSVQASATNHEAIALYHERYGIQRAVLPRVLTLSQVAHVVRHTPVEIEVFGFGSLCVMVEGRCALSSYATGCSPNNAGVCSPAEAVRWDDAGGVVNARLGGVLIDRYAPDEPRAYPTLCKGRFDVQGQVAHALEEPTSLNTLDVLPDLWRAGVRAIKIEGRQRSAAYIEQVTRVWRQALDRLTPTDAPWQPSPQWHDTLARLSEGRQTTLGALSRPWQ